MNSLSRSNNVKRNLVFGLASKIVSLVLPFISRTIIIKYLGVEYTGLGSLFSSILTVLSLSELGIGSAIIFGMYKPVAQNDVEKLNAYMAFLRKCYVIIGGVVLSLGLIILPFLSYLIEGEYPDGINIYILYLIYLLNSVVGYLCLSYRDAIISANQRVDIISKITTIVAIIQELLQIVILLLFKDYLLFSLAMLLGTIACNLIKYLVSKKMYPQIKPCGKLAPSEIRTIKTQVSGLLFQKIGSIVLSSVDTIVISSYLGLVTLGLYNNYHYIISVLLGFFTIIPASVIPSIGNSIQTETVEKNYSDFKLFHFVYSWVIIFCSACLLTLYQPFIKLWLGSNYLFDFSFVIVMVLYFYSYKFTEIVYVYREATGLWAKWKYVSIIAAVFNLVSNIILVQFIGLYGIMISTILAKVLIYLPFFSYPLFKDYFNSKKMYYKYLLNQLLYFVIAVLVCVSTFFLCSLVPDEGIWLFIIKLTICILFSNLLMTIIFFRTQKFKAMLSFLKRNIFRVHSS